MVVPDFQDDHLALFPRQPGQAAHRLAFLRALRRRMLEPAMRFELTGQPAPETPAKIERPVAKRANTIMLRLFWRFVALHQSNERFLQNILGLAMAQAERPAIKQQVSRFGLIEGFAPPGVIAGIHNVTG